MLLIYVLLIDDDSDDDDGIILNANDVDDNIANAMNII
jgi:hypothetical protein